MESFPSCFNHSLFAGQLMLKYFPSNFQRILDLQNTSVLGMANGFAPDSRKSAVSILHKAAGTHGDRISQQCNRNLYVVGATDRWCRSDDAHILESFVVGPILDIFYWDFGTCG